MNETKFWNKGPETLLLERLFGDVTELGDEELDLLYTSIASRSDRVAASREVRAQSAHRHRVPGNENEEIRQPEAPTQRSDRQTGSQKQCQPATGAQRGDAAENSPRASKKSGSTKPSAIYDGRVSRLLSRRKH